MAAAREVEEDRSRGPRLVLTSAGGASAPERLKKKVKMMEEERSEGMR